MRKKEAEDAPNIVTGTFSLLTQPVDALFDLGATHSFISTKLVKILGLIRTHKSPLLSMTLPDGKLGRVRNYTRVALLEYRNVSS